METKTILREIVTIDQYIEGFLDDRQVVMKKLRDIIREEAPEAKEKISWGMPTFYQGGNLIHFAQSKNHLGIYPGTDAVIAFCDELKDYKTSKGAIQIPNSKPIPEDLIKKIVRYNLSKIRRA